MDAQSRHLHLLSRVDRHIKTAAEKYTRKNKGLLRGTIPPFCQALSISNTSTLQQMQILLCKANKDKQKNKQTSSKQTEQPTFCHPADTKLQQVLVCSLLSYQFRQLPIMDISPSMIKEHCMGGMFVYRIETFLL